MDLDFRLLGPGDPALNETFDVMQTAFAGMKGRIDPPSSVLDLTFEELSRIAATAEVWVLGDPIDGTVILTTKASVLQIAKLAVRDQRGGVGRALLEFANARAAALGLEWLELRSRVELLEVHVVFKSLGFHEVARLSHDGYTRPTSILFRKTVA